MFCFSVTSLREILLAQERDVAVKTRACSANERQVLQKDRENSQKEAEISRRESEISHKELDVSEKERQVFEKQQAVSKKEAGVSEAEGRAASEGRRLSGLSDELTRKMREVDGRETRQEPERGTMLISVVCRA